MVLRFRCWSPTFDETEDDGFWVDEASRDAAARAYLQLCVDRGSFGHGRDDDKGSATVHTREICTEQVYVHKIGWEVKTTLGAMLSSSPFVEPEHDGCNCSGCSRIRRDDLELKARRRKEIQENDRKILAQLPIKQWQPGSSPVVVELKLPPWDCSTCMSKGNTKERCGLCGAKRP